MVMFLRMIYMMICVLQPMGIVILVYMGYIYSVAKVVVNRDAGQLPAK